MKFIVAKAMASSFNITANKDPHQGLIDIHKELQLIQLHMQH